MILLKEGGLMGGGINFDAKLRRNSTDNDDIFHAHIGGADVFARSLIIADKIIKESNYLSIVENRYKSFDNDLGKKFEMGDLSLKDLYKIALKNPDIKLISGKQELIENLINQYL